MLIEFVCRWRVFEDALLSMVAAGASRDGAPDHLSGGKGLRSVAVIYGPNGAGKSTLVNGLSIVRELVMGGITVENAATGATKRFEVVLETAGRTYLYLLELAMGFVAAEALTEIRKEDERIIFRRSDELVSGVDADPAPDELLLVQLAAEGGVDGVQDVVRWFRRLDIIREDTVLGGMDSPGVSRGTALAWRCRRAVETGGVLVVDNLDLHLHPVVVSDLVEFMQHAEGAQLIATTNAVHLLNSHMLERDQIWFIDPRSDGTSDLYSLLEFPEDDAVLRGRDMMVNYLVGRCGGIPVQQDLRKMWEGGLYGGSVPG